MKLHILNGDCLQDILQAENAIIVREMFVEGPIISDSFDALLRARSTYLEKTYSIPFDEYQRKFVSEFETNFSKIYNVKNVISCANGTDSLYIIMKMLGIKSGDEVITVSNSWISSSETITQVGAKPIFVDIDPVYYKFTLKDNSEVDIAKMTVTIKFEDKVEELKIKRCRPN